MELVILFLAFLGLGLASLRWGVDTTHDVAARGRQQPYNWK